MSGPDLSSRLRRLKQAAPSSAAPPPREDLHLLLPGWEKIGALVWKRVEYSEKIQYGDLGEPVFRNPRFGKDEILFLDTETTGLSGGAGNIIFLVGIGRFTGDRFGVEQYFLEDFPGEGIFLQNVLSSFPKGVPLVVSYNGKGFDMPLLKTRFILNRMQLPVVEHLDLLYPARRLWRRVFESCSLSSIEENVLGISREEDVPGREIPDRYFTFLRKKEPELLSAVFSHNFQDILSLAELLSLLEKLVARPAGIWKSGIPCDFYGLSLLVQKGDSAASEELLHTAVKEGDLRAVIMLSRQLKRENRWEEALDLWKQLWENGSSFAGIELAKYYEHREKDYQRALDYVDRLFLFRPGVEPRTERMRTALRKRKKRLEQKTKG